MQNIDVESDNYNIITKFLTYFGVDYLIVSPNLQLYTVQHGERIVRNQLKDNFQFRDYNTGTNMIIRGGLAVFETDDIKILKSKMNLIEKKLDLILSKITQEKN